MAAWRTIACTALLLSIAPWGASAADVGLFSADVEAVPLRQTPKRLPNGESLREGGLPEGATGELAASPELHSRIAAINFGQLAAARSEVAQGRPSNLRLNLFADAEFEAVIERTEPTASGHTLTGRLANDPLSTVVLAINGDYIAGTVWLSDGMYDIRTLGAGAAVIRQLDPAALGRCGVGEAPPEHQPDVSPVLRLPDSPPARRSHADGPAASPQAAPRAENAAPADDGSVIDVLVVYTSGTRILHGGHRVMRAMVDRDVAMTNEAYRASGAAQRIALAGAVEVDWPFHEIHAAVTVLNVLEGRGDRYFEEVHALRDLYAADLVILHTGDLGSRAGGSIGGGIAFGTSSPAGNERLAFSIASSSAFAHELGHGMGLNHERQYDRSNEPFPYSHGYRFEVPCPEPDWPLACEVRTIMSAQLPHIPRFSSPRRKWPDESGVPLGVPGDEPSDRADGPADAVRSLNEMRRVIANYRASATRCEYALSPELPVLPAAGGEFRLRVETAPGCAWSARSDGEFLSIAEGSSGMGGGELVYRAPANPGWEREAALLVAAEVYLVRQEGLRPIAPVCERSPQVSEALARALDKPCAEVAGADLASTGTLRVVLPRGATLKPDDFSGLSGLGWLAIDPEELWKEKPSLRLEPGLFDGLSRLRYLRVQGNAISTLPPSLFKDLSELRVLDLSINQLADLKPGVFDGLANLEDLRLDWNNLSKLQLGVFDGLTNLLRLTLTENQLTTLPVGLFDSLSKLDRLNLINNSLTALRPSLFNGLGSKRQRFSLSISGNQLTALESGLFDGLPNLDQLDVAGNRLTTLPAALFDGISRLEYFDASDNRLIALPSNLFAGLPLDRLFLNGNRLTSLPPKMFEGLTKLITLDLSDNPGSPFALRLELAAPPAPDSPPGQSAAVAVEVAAGVPFDVQASLSASGGALSTYSTLLKAGQIRGGPISVAPQGDGPVRVELDAISGILKEWECDDILYATVVGQRCYWGVRTAAGGPLIFYGLPNQTLALDGATKFDLHTAFPDFGEGTSYAVESSYPHRVVADVAGGLLTITAAESGETTVAVTATSADGRMETRRFTVTVERPVSSLWGGWRSVLLQPPSSE